MNVESAWDRLDKANSKMEADSLSTLYHQAKKDLVCLLDLATLKQPVQAHHVQGVLNGRWLSCLPAFHTNIVSRTFSLEGEQ